MDFLEYRILRWLLFSGTLWNFTDHLQRLYHLRNSGHFLHIILNQNELVRLTSDRRKLLSLMKRSRGQLRIARASRMPHSSGQVELPPGQGQLLHTLEAWDEGTSPCFFITSTADQMQKFPLTTNTIEMRPMSATRIRNFPRLKNCYCSLRRTPET